MVTTPVYKIIEMDIKKQLNDGVLKSGDCLPSESELTEKYSVSRMTVRHALNLLVSEGYLYKYKGKGTFVTDKKIDKNIVGMRSFTKEMEQLKRKVSNKVVSFSEEKASKEIAEKLFLSEGDIVTKIERLRLANDIPILFEEVYLPTRLFKDINIEVFNHSFYEYVLNDLKMVISNCMQEIGIGKANKIQSKELEVPENESLLLVIRNSFLSSGRPFEYVKSYYRPDRYRFIQYSSMNQ